jgi:hypothetical protein
VWCPIFELAALLGWRAVVRRGAAAAQGGNNDDPTDEHVKMEDRSRFVQDCIAKKMKT